MIKKLRRKIITFTVLMIAAVTAAFTIGTDVYLIKKTERELYSSLSAEIEQAQKNENDKTEIGKDAPKDIARTEICVVKITKNSDGEQTASTLTESTYLSEDLLSSAVELLTEKYDLSVPVIAAPPADGDKTPPDDGNRQPSAQPPAANERREGVLRDLSLVYSVQSNPDGIFIAFADLDYLKAQKSRIAVFSASFDGALILVSFLVAAILSRIAVRPVAQSIEEQKRFIADASHELKTPLAVISANNQILLSGAAEAQKEWLNSTSEEIKIMNDVLRDMLTLAQGEALSGITKVNADVSKIADGICLQFDAVAFEKNITLESRIQENVFADCDEKMIRRLFTILIDNAVKYEPEGGKVFVALQKNGNKTTFAVRNCGSTVKKEDLPHLFERFYRADKSRSGGGVGLGLAIAKNIADLHGGTIKAASSETTGTLFIAEF